MHAGIPPSLEYLKSLPGRGDRLTPELLVDASQKGSDAFVAVDALLKGRELPLPEGVSFKDKDGFARRDVRIKWWLNAGSSYGDIALPPYVVEQNPELGEVPLPTNLQVGYGGDEPPVLFGHYWFDGELMPEAANVACLDYSVPRPTGKLVAYRWSGERELVADNFESVGNMGGSSR